MAKKITKKSAKKKTAPDSTAGKGFVGTDAVLVQLDKVEPNPWNPNEMTPFEEESLAHGLKTGGWLKSHSLLIWGRDQKGKEHNLIIDGEHRWKAAQKIGLTQGPMVFMHGITEKQAREINVQLTMRRGKPNDDKLGDVLKTITDDFGADVALDFGITEDRLAALIGETAAPIPEPEPVVPLASGQAEHTRTLQLVFDHAGYKEFVKVARKVATRLGTKSHADTVLAALKQVMGGKKEQNGAQARA